MKINLLSLLLVCTCGMLKAQIPTEEKQALLTIFEATNGVSWTNSWDLSEDPSTWYGITVTNDHVTKIELFMNNMEGTLPDVFEAFPNLEVLHLGFNKLLGQLPQSIATLDRLNTLELFMNRFYGAIPKAYGNLKQLEVLSLYSNQIAGDIPEALTTLKALKVVQLNSNALTGNIPKAIGQMKQLEILSLYDNHLSGIIPSSIIELQALKELNLADNLLVGQIPQDLMALPSIEYILVNNNNLKDNFERLSSLLGSQVVFEYQNMGVTKEIGLANTD